jgi:hypothetical protein
VVDALRADVSEVSRRDWTIQTLSLDAGPAFAGQEFVFFGSMSGTEPGIEQSGFTIPIHPDGYTQILIGQPQLSPVAPLHGYLDGAGRATATFELVRRWRSATVVGETFHHAFAVLDAQGNLVFVSNAVPVTVRP